MTCQACRRCVSGVAGSAVQQLQKLQRVTKLIYNRTELENLAEDGESPVSEINKPL